MAMLVASDPSRSSVLRIVSLLMAPPICRRQYMRMQGTAIPSWVALLTAAAWTMQVPAGRMETMRQMGMLAKQENKDSSHSFPILYSGTLGSYFIYP